ncbi:hypothetical protein ACHAWF_003655 [Thalassiosira exigua]
MGREEAMARYVDECESFSSAVGSGFRRGSSVECRAGRVRRFGRLLPRIRKRTISDFLGDACGPWTRFGEANSGFRALSRATSRRRSLGKTPFRALLPDVEAANRSRFRSRRPAPLQQEASSSGRCVSRIEERLGGLSDLQGRVRLGRRSRRFGRRRSPARGLS